jgi:hypothetical protein
LGWKLAGGEAHALGHWREAHDLAEVATLGWAGDCEGTEVSLFIFIFSFYFFSSYLILTLLELANLGTAKSNGERVENILMPLNTRR